MRSKFKLFLIPSVLALSIVVGLSIIFYDYWTVREPLHAKVTETRMRELMRILDNEQPLSVDSESLRKIVERNKHGDLLKDAWGSDLVIERDVHETGRYTIISLGRDRRRGICCRRWVSDWDDDAVLSGDEWLQVWKPELR
jgi:hypothetical protein